MLSYGVLLWIVVTAVYMHIRRRTLFGLTRVIPTIVAVDQTLLVAFQLVISADVDGGCC